MGRADVALRELVGEILCLQGHLTGHVQRDRIGAMIVKDLA
ncbi:Uncharacterised protein [Mycobacteroides abscessus subsp. abscessus]|nr:Uncharacterised protein [Mycobacteroides abscessus subsp. abscessus]